MLNIRKESTIFWTDSTNVLWWVKGHSRHFKSFVANRIGKMQAATNTEKWRYVTTKEHPADYLTPGVCLRCSKLKQDCHCFF